MTATPRRRRWLRLVAAAAVVIVLLVAAGLFFLDRILLSSARSAGADLGRQWGRPVEIGGVATRLLAWQGVKVTDLRIGPGAGEPRNLLELDRAEVHVGLWRALLSRGREVSVGLLEVQGLRVNVLRLPDGTTNVERLARASAGPPPEPAPAPRAGPSDLSFLRVDAARLAAARIGFLDLGRPGAKELFVDQLDVEVRDLRAGRPLEVVLRAAVLAQRQNLELRVHAAPLPPSLQPTVDHLVLKVQPIDLDALAPFLPAAAGFLGGRLEADLDAALGAAVPGGSGPTSVKGGFAARGLRFRGQEGGQPLDVVLDADLDGDAGRGDLRIGKLLLTAGPATVTGAGRATGLAGDAPRLEGLQLVARGLDPRALAAYYPPLRGLVGDRVQGPIGLELRAAGDAASPAVELRLDLTPVRLALPDQLAKAAGAPLTATARATFPRGATRVAAHADLAGVDLRPGGSLNKAPGDRLALDALLELKRTAEGGQAVDLRKLELLLPGDAVSAHGTASVAQGGAGRAVRFDLTAESARLDLDRLLLAAPARPAKKGKPLDPEAFAGVAGTVVARVGEVRYHKASLRDLTARLRLTGDELVVEEARLAGLGGKVSADGTRMKLAHPAEPAKVKVKVEGVDAGEVIALYSSRKVLSGKLSADLDLAAAGASGPELAKSLQGALSGKLFDGLFHGKDLVGGVLGPLGKALPLASQKVAEGGPTSLGKELPFSVKIADGTARLDRPLQVSTPRAGLSISGGAVGLDGALDLPVTVSLTPDTVAALTGGRARPSEAVPVTLRLTGPAWDPHLGDLGLQPAVAAIVKSAGGAAVSQLLGNLGGAAKGGAAKPGAAAPAGGAQPPPQDPKKKLENTATDALKGLLGR